MPTWIKLIPTIFGFTGFSVVFILYKSQLITNLNKFNTRFYSFFNNKWYFDHIYNLYIGSFIFWLSYNICYKAIDKGILEFLGASNIGNLVYRTSKWSIYYQTGVLYNYVSLLVFSWLIILFFFEITV
jgi:NADH:ubiquinone oxidoreductase subunit 5 (subunit L)/multisubunit Na+/H+ antiporter MnhA subunit